jgi:cytochrome oxidase assembly protein ShyY1
VTAQPVAADTVMYRPVLLRGTFDTAHTVLLDNRPHMTNGVSQPGFEVLIPLVLEGAGGPSGRAVLVNRGWLPRDPVDRTRIAPTTTPAGEVQVEGIAVPHASRVFSLGRKDGTDLRAKSACRCSPSWSSSNPTRKTACGAIGRAQTWAPTATMATRSSGSRWQRRCWR